MSTTDRSRLSDNSRIAAGDRVAFKDPDAGNHADDDCLYFADEIPESIVSAFENSDYSTYIWETRHNPNHHLHDELGDKCDWGDEETVRTSGR
jgi:hypothetical protein